MGHKACIQKKELPTKFWLGNPMEQITQCG
jgi:hypothetical protein